MNLLVADLAALRTLRDRSAIDILFHSGGSLYLIDTVEWAILDGAAAELWDWYSGNRSRILPMESPFTKELVKSGDAWILAGKPKGMRPDPDYGLLAAWVAAGIADEVRGGRIAADAWEVLVEQPIAVELFEAAGVRVLTPRAVASA